MKESPFYTLIVDENLDALFRLIFQAFLTHPYFKKTLADYKLEKTFHKFIRECSNEHHALGWCKDPNCLREQKV